MPRNGPSQTGTSAPAPRLRAVLAELRRNATGPAGVEGMARFGIRPPHVLGVSVPFLRSVGRKLGRDHALAGRLWATGIFDARLLAVFVDDPTRVTTRQREAWVRDFDNWAICDTCCGDLFRKTVGVHRAIERWSRRPEQFVKRAAFALIANLAVHEKELPDSRFRHYLRLVERESTDERLYVRKGVNWALRQVGKRNPALRRAAVAVATRIRRKKSASARWVAADALRELRSPAVEARFRRVRSRSATA